MISLTKGESRYLRLFFEKNTEWIQNNSLLDEKNINKLIDMYGEFLEENHLTHSRSLLMFLVVMKQEATKARINKHSIRVQSLNMNKIPLTATLSNNQTVNMWINASNVQVGQKKDYLDDEIDFYELDRIIMARREKMQVIKEKQKTK